MLSRRTLFFLSVPGFALLWGFFMIKKRKIESEKKEEKTKETKLLSKMNQSECVNISKKNATPETKFGKSAPINIQTNGKMSYKNCIDKSVDCGTFMEDSLNSIITLSNIPDSVSKKNIYKCTKYNTDNAVIVKASSPSNVKNLLKNDTKKEFKTSEILMFEKNSDNNGSFMESKKGLKYMNVMSPDSGKGSSLPHSETPNVNYEFILPTSLIGQLYGRKRTHINQIKSQTGANISIKNHPMSKKINICVISGSENDVNSALCLIRTRLPSKLYPNLTLQRIHHLSQQAIVPLSSEHSQSMQMQLIEGINNDVIISFIVNGGNIFVQQPLHPSHPSLTVLQNCLNNIYNNIDTPMLPEITNNAICVGKVENNWYRLQIIERIEEDNLLLKILDFGGFIKLDINNLRQIRTDFMSIPFQATECVLSNIEPIGNAWSETASSFIQGLTQGKVLQAQIAGYNNQNVPEIYLFSSLGANNIVFINKELVARQLANWVET